VLQTQRIAIVVSVPSRQVLERDEDELVARVRLNLQEQIPDTAGCSMEAAQSCM